MPHLWVPLALYLVALLARLRIWHVAPYGDEGGFYYLSRNLWPVPPNLHDVYGPVWYYPGTWFVAERPFFYLVMWPAAQFGFDAYRLFHLTVAAGLAPLLFLAARRAGARPGLAALGAVGVALWPPLVAWGTLALMDSFVAVAFTAALAAGPRPRLEAAMVALALGLKQSAIFGALFLLAWAIVSRRPRRHQAYLAAAVAFGLVMFAVAAALGARPGGTAAGHGLRLFEQLFLSAWLAPVLLAGLWLREARPWAALGLLYPFTFLAMHVLLHRSVEAWYVVLPNVLVLLGVVVTLDRALRHEGRPRLRAAAKAGAVLLALLLVLGILVPVSAAKARALHPLQPVGSESLTQMYSYEETRDLDRLEAFAHLSAGPGFDVFVVDLYGSHAMHPLVTSGANVTLGSSVHASADRVHEWAMTVEAPERLTLIDKIAAPMNEALRATYGDCVEFENMRYVIIQGEHCAGRSDRLAEEFQARVTA